MWIYHCTAVFRVKLNAHIPFVRTKFDNFNKVRFLVHTAANHSGIFEIGFVGIVEFVTVTVTLADIFLFVNIVNFGSFFQVTFISTQTHAASQIEHIFLFFHDIHNVVCGSRIDFGAVSIGITQYITGKFDRHGLHTHTYSQTWQIVFAGIFQCRKFTFHTTLTESGSHDNTICFRKFFLHILIIQFIRKNQIEFKFAVVVGTCMHQRLNNRFVGIGQLHIFSHNGNAHFVFGIFEFFNKSAPFVHVGMWRFGQIEAHFSQCHLVELFKLHIQRYAIN